jgi:hypothetical protein
MNGLVVVKLVMISPFVDLAVTGCMAVATALWARDSAWKFPVLAVSTWLLVGTCAGGIGAVLPSVSICREEASRTGAFLQAHIPASAKVMGEETFWIYLQDNRYQSWKDISPRMQQTGQSFSQVMRSTDADYFIVDDGVVGVIQSNMADPFFRSLGVSPQDFWGELARVGSEVAQLETGCHGRVALYALNKSMLGS